jgi:hypothetical protein|tara:strand:+ start:1062 stop:1964 length:903 start_codon:yes stop_codon:yes gene_type:complete
MTKIAYEERRFAAKTALVIDQANEIMEDYDSITLRGLYYQFVARNYLENTIRNYKKLGDIIRNARMAGRISWDLMTDRTRSLYGYNTSANISQAFTYASYSYKEDLHLDQDNYIEVWCEKDALTGTINRPCNHRRISYFPTKGYPSISALKDAADRFQRQVEAGKKCIVLYLSDLDPEGIAMPKTVQETFNTMGVDVTIERIGLTLEQVRLYNPPSSLAKATSSRLDDYIEEIGTSEVWELDALSQDVTRSLISDRLDELIDQDRFNAAKQIESRNMRRMVDIADRMDEVIEFLYGDEEE